MSDFDVRKREILTLLNEVIVTEQHLRSQGVEVSEPDDWMQLKDIVARIERRLLANIPATAE